MAVGVIPTEICYPLHRHALQRNWKEFSAHETHDFRLGHPHVRSKRNRRRPRAAPRDCTSRRTSRGHAVSPMLYGIFFEEINRAGDGGLYAEMIQNRSFEDSEKEPSAWTIEKSGEGATVEIDRAHPTTQGQKFNPSTLRIRLPQGGDGAHHQRRLQGDVGAEQADVPAFAHGARRRGRHDRHAPLARRQADLRHREAREDRAGSGRSSSIASPPPPTTPTPASSSNARAPATLPSTWSRSSRARAGTACRCARISPAWSTTFARRSCVSRAGAGWRARRSPARIDGRKRSATSPIGGRNTTCGSTPRRMAWGITSTSSSRRRSAPSRSSSSTAACRTRKSRR